MLPFPVHPPHHHRAPRFPLVASATAYTPCSSGSITAMGTRTHWGEVASNHLRLGARIELRRPRLRAQALPRRGPRVGGHAWHDDEERPDRAFLEVEREDDGETSIHTFVNDRGSLSSFTLDRESAIALARDLLKSVARVE